ncbi:DUF3343 domain-containing protein [Acetobacteroides hydrogenigenes]|uniref:Uncharacterized protein DUF3343 n=1 Tax=Acetobacteroides hydrogenigenes TaxID=979970 RepID=A0A4V2RNQ2_9BACT|nr:DUF3343 domain-containing protein [Acetobacteroides hydrogenigenes]TCN64500.1 uncharacterized protein DUF3343 [Acetobacteroides hydrogenigenes]
MPILLFKNVRAVIEAEKLLVAAGVSVVIRPVPTNISSECGMCIQMSIEDSNKGCDLLREKEILFQLIEQ